MLTLSVSILEIGEGGGQWEELAPILKLIVIGHRLEAFEVLDGESALFGNSIRGLAAESEDAILICILILFRVRVIFILVLVANASHLRRIPPNSLTTAVEHTDYIATFHLCK